MSTGNIRLLHLGYTSCSRWGHSVTAVWAPLERKWWWVATCLPLFGTSSPVRPAPTGQWELSAHGPTPTDSECCCSEIILSRRCRKWVFSHPNMTMLFVIFTFYCLTLFIICLHQRYVLIYTNSNIKTWTWGHKTHCALIGLFNLASGAWAQFAESSSFFYLPHPAVGQTAASFCPFLPRW